jgi:beta-glucosidase
MGWEIYPEGIAELLLWLADRYDNPPVYITENGAAFEDTVGDDGRVHDEQRRAYIEQHLGAVSKARERGVDVRGYFAWSLLDNFEWSYGYDKRFGIVRVDYDTQKRTPKNSALWYSDVIGRNGV